MTSSIASKPSDIAAGSPWMASTSIAMPTATATKSARFQTRRNFLLQYQTRRRLVMSSIRSSFSAP